MCTIHHPLFSSICIIALTCAIIFIPPAFAILTSSFYRGSTTLYGEAGGVRIFFTVMFCIFLWLGDTPWQLYRALTYYQGGVETPAIVMIGFSEHRYRIPFYQYEPPFPSNEQRIIADASLVRRAGRNSSSFNWLHKTGDSVFIRVRADCPTIAWTQVQDLSLLVGLLPGIGGIGIWFVPKRFLMRQDLQPKNDWSDDGEPDKERWHRP